MCIYHELKTKKEAIFLTLKKKQKSNWNTINPHGVN